MAEYDNSYEETEEALTPEEAFQQHQAEIDARFEEEGFFTRLGRMFSGLGKPKSSREYKLAVTELQRLSAPLVAILLPVLGVIVLIVVTAVQGNSKEVIQVDLARAVEEEEELQEEEPEPEVEPETPPEEMPDIVVDTPTVGPVSDMVAPTPVSNEPVSVKPAQQDSVAIIKSPVKMRSMAGSRSPGMIGKMTRGGAGYGDATTEAAVLKALRWLKKTQKPDGSWDGSQKISDAGLAILTYLAHGETPASEEFGKTVAGAIQFLVNQQYTDASGTCRFKGTDGNEYAFLIATYALCEAYGMTKNPNAKMAAMKGLERIVNNQGPNGGWDYKINKASVRDDMSFEGWALQAVKAGKMAGLHPEGLDECIKKAMKCLKTRNFKNGGFNYTAGGNPTGLTATGCLAMQLLGYGAEPEVLASLNTMGAWVPTFDRSVLKVNGGGAGGNPQYYCYYAAQCKYQAGMKEGAKPEDTKLWQAWNQEMKRVYPDTIVDAGTIPGPKDKPVACGYWENNDANRSNGHVMPTCLCALQLMVYYRYLPGTKLESSKDAAPAKTRKRPAADVNVEVDI